MCSRNWEFNNLTNRALSTEFSIMDEKNLLIKEQDIKEEDMKDTKVSYKTVYKT